MNRLNFMSLVVAASTLLPQLRVAAMTLPNPSTAIDCKSSSTSPWNFAAQFGPEPQPFTICVDERFLQETKAKAGSTRLVIDIDQPDFVDGVPSRLVKSWADYWANEYDWRAVEKILNAKFHHFTTTVHAGKDYTYTDPIPLHFIHHKSPRDDAIPLLFVHGWPGTFHEVANIIDTLTNPPSASLPAFHVVAPDLPGFGFSPAPLRRGLGPRGMGQGFHDLMSQLGYDRYVGQGGDFGSHILRLMAVDFPASVVSVLSNMFTVAPNATDLARFAANQTTAEETALIAGALDPAFSWTKAYWDLEKSVPLQAALGLTDSPVAWLSWQFLGMRMLVPGYEWEREELITWAMLNYIQGPYGGLRLYKEMNREGFLEGSFPYIKQPVGVVKYFGDAGYHVPFEWAQREGNITFFRQKPEPVVGGHFPAYINPQSLAQDCWDFWGDSAISGTDVFKS